MQFQFLKLCKRAVLATDKVEASLAQFDEELFNYLVEYRRKVQKIRSINSENKDVKEWLEWKKRREGDEHREFYQKLHQNLDQAYRNVKRESLSCGSNVTATELPKMLNIRNNVWNEGLASL